MKVYRFMLLSVVFSGFIFIRSSSTLADEKYAALVADGTANEIRLNTYADSDTPEVQLKELAAESPKPVAHKQTFHSKKRRSSIKKVATQAIDDSYDVVPPKHIEELQERLKLINELLRHGRAYDYRMKTLRELRSALQSVEEQDSPKTSTNTIKTTTKATTTTDL